MLIRVVVYTMGRTAVTNVYKKFAILHAKKIFKLYRNWYTMKYLNIDYDMEVTDYGL